MANSRYSDFADFFSLRYKDSICRSGYDQTLRQIAELLKRDCFTLDKGPAGDREDYITVKRKAVGESTFTPVPKSTTGFSGDGWFYYYDKTTTNGVPVAEVCLAGSYKRVIGDSYEITLVSDVSGLDSSVPAP
jgi:hypothetical protein